MKKYYYQIINNTNHISFLWFQNPKNWKWKNKKLNINSLNKSNSKDSNQTQTKKEVGSSNKKKRLLENWQPVEIFVDLTAIGKDFNKTKYTHLSFNDLKSPIEKVKDILSELIMVNISKENRDLLKIASYQTSKGFDNTHILILWRYCYVNRFNYFNVLWYNGSSLFCQIWNYLTR